MLPTLGGGDGSTRPNQQRRQLPALLHNVTPVQGHLPLPPLPAAAHQPLAAYPGGDSLDATLSPSRSAPPASLITACSTPFKYPSKSDTGAPSPALLDLLQK